MLNARPVHGRFRTLRTGANVVLIVVLFAIPWIQIAGEPLVMLDVPNRRFHVFGLVIFPQELYFLWLLVIGAALALFFFTALFGRLWCGWACPQTVFTDVFAGASRWIQGWKGSVPPRKIASWRVAATHAAWVLASLVIGFHLVSYFVAPRTLIADALSGEIHPAAAGFHLAAATLAYIDFVFMRQIFCRFLCPYARFQGVLFDRDTLVIAYDEKRGEPRGKKGTVEGDCVNCNLCVVVCPSDIDIRDGLQLDCIACTQCIDACNGVMQRTGREADLIAYRSLASLDEDREPRLLRPRVLVYGALLAATVAAFVLLLGQRVPMSLTVAHNRDALTTRMADGRIGNAFTLHVENRLPSEREFHLRIEERDTFELVTGVNPVRVPAAGAVEVRVFVIAREGNALGGNFATPIRFALEATDDDSASVVREAQFLKSAGSGGPNVKESGDG